MLIAPDAHNDCVMELDVDIGASREAGAPVVRLLRLGSLAQTTPQIAGQARAAATR